MKKFLAVILICMATVVGAADVITPRFSDLILKGGPWVDVRAFGAVGDSTGVGVGTDVRTTSNPLPSMTSETRRAN